MGVFWLQQPSLTGMTAPHKSGPRNDAETAAFPSATVTRHSALKPREQTELGGSGGGHDWDTQNRASVPVVCHRHAQWHRWLHEEGPWDTEMT